VPAFKLDLRAAAANSPRCAAAAIEHETTNLAATINTVNVTVLADPLKERARASDVDSDALAHLIAQVTSTIRARSSKSGRRSRGSLSIRLAAVSRPRSRRCARRWTRSSN